VNATFSHQQFTFLGISEGGIRTCITLPSLNLMFDIGTLPVENIHIRNLFLTHAHLDHSAGVPYYISQRTLLHLSPPNIYIHPTLKEPLEEILSIYSKLEDCNYKYNLHPMNSGEKIVLNKNYFVSSYPSFHRVPSQGYTIYETKRKLKLEYIGLKNQEIVELKKKGTEISEEKTEPVISFSGDTKIEYLLENEDVRKSKVLFLECTYIDQDKTVDHTRRWGHIHLDEIIANADKFENERIVLIHFSKRYPDKYILKTIYNKIPDSLKTKVHCFLP
jgi:ribonuclease Z